MNEEDMALQIRSNITEGLRKIQIAWNGIKTERNRSLDNFEKWCICRHRTLSALQKFQDEFDKIHLYSSTGRAVGNGATLLGSLAAIVGLGLSFSKDLKPIGDELVKYGSTVGAVGGAMTITASLAECGFNYSVLNEVKATLEEDERQTRELLDWFERTEMLESHLREVFGCGVLNISTILTAVREVSVLYSKGGKALDNIQSYLSVLIKGNFSLDRLPSLDNKGLEAILYKASYKVQLLLLEFCKNPAVRRATLGIYDSFKKNPISFDLSKISIRIMRNAAVQKIAMVSHLPSPGGQCLMSCFDLTTRGIFGAINIAVSFLALLSSVKDIKNGKSKYSDMLKKTHSYLLIELNELESYPMLRK